MNENMESRYDLLTKSLRVLMYIAIVSLVNSLINFLPFVPASVTTWISRGIMAAMVVCMFQLAPLNGRYKKAGIFRAMMLSCSLITAFLFGSMLLTLAASAFSILAVYQEYSAHSELVSDKDSNLSRKWHSLFYWVFAAAVLLSFGSSVVALILVMPDLEVGAASRISGIIIGLLKIPQFVIDVVYLLYLKKMTGYFQNEGEVYGNDV